MDPNRGNSYRSEGIQFITEVGGKGAKFADSEGGVERNRAGDNKDKSGFSVNDLWQFEEVD